MSKRSSPRAGAKTSTFFAEAEIETMGHAGDGVAHVEGREIFVPYTVPGDRVRLAVMGARGEVVARLADGPGRASPPCPHFGACGGCVAQHLSKDTYRAWKRGLVVSALRQRGLATECVAPLESVAPGTRRRVALAFSHNVKRTVLGFHRRQSSDLIEIASCAVAVPVIADALPRLRVAFAAHLPAACRGTLHLTATETGLDADLAFATAPDAPDLVLREQLAKLAAEVGLARLSVGGEPFVVARTPLVRFAEIAVALPPRAFLQPCRDGEAFLTAGVREALDGARFVLDLYAGLGTLSLPLAKSVRVHAVDVDADALAALARAAKGLTVSVERRDLGANPLAPAQLKAYDAAVFDPPRAGALAQVKALAEARIPRIAAVSCNPATFARDARALVDRGYRMDWVRPLDQFLWSAHVELVALFARETP